MTTEIFVLSLDPGITTGYALLDLNGSIVEVGSVRPTDIDTLAELEHSRNLEVIIEYTPVPTLSEMNMKLREVIAKLRIMFPRHVEIKPGQWKQTPVIRHTVPNRWKGKTLSAHMRDAIRMGIYYLTFVRSSK